MKKKLTKENFSDVLNNINTLFVASDEDTQEIWVDIIDELLDNLSDDDFFGTEGQLDPRGDNRD